MFGYECFFAAATFTSYILQNAGIFAAECSDAQFQAFAVHVVHAAELMQQPRRYGDVAIIGEAEFTDALRMTIAEAGAGGLDTRLVQLLADALHRLQRSGVLQARRIEECDMLLKSKRDAQAVAMYWSRNAPGLRSCALPGCDAEEAHPTHFKSCAACRTVVYCCREHQVAGWPSHKKACKAARKAAAAEDDEAGASGA